MSDQEFLAKRGDWLKLKKEFDYAQEELDRLTAAYLRSEGPAPSQKELERLNNLLAELHQARGEVDQLILDIST